ncbi:MAG: hypothetical protein CK538_08050 [Opitutia bacterium]|nr:3'-5' exonuclease [Opitutaceae bacterium]PHX85187.1 MAG: hypothetical protein CK538_08050 [Opitutae bacterium]
MDQPLLESRAFDGSPTPEGRKWRAKLVTNYTVQTGSLMAGLAHDIAQHAPALFIGHNVAFDRPRVLREFSLLRLAENLSPLPTFCTMQNTVQVCRIPRYNGGYKWPKLEELHVHLFGRGLTQAHDARADVLACARCFFELRRRGLVASR